MLSKCKCKSIYFQGSDEYTVRLGVPQKYTTETPMYHIIRRYIHQMRLIVSIHFLITNEKSV